MYAAVRDAKDSQYPTSKSGVSGADVYQSVVDFFKDQGYESTTRDFVHNLGHGRRIAGARTPDTVGPAGLTLKAGHVITVEPGLYYPGIGGVRLEDMGEVTATRIFLFHQHFPRSWSYEG